MVYCAHRFRSLIHFPELQATPWARISWSLREFRSWSTEHDKGARNSEGSSRPSSTRPEPAPNPRPLRPPFRSRSRPWPQRAGRVPAGTQTPRGALLLQAGSAQNPEPRHCPLFPSAPHWQGGPGAPGASRAAREPVRAAPVRSDPIQTATTTSASGEARP